MKEYCSLWSSETLLFLDTYADLAVRLDANLDKAEVDDNAAIQALMAGAAQA